MPALGELRATRSQFTVGQDAPNALKQSLMYKLSYYRFGQATKGLDFARRAQIDSTEIQLHHFEEVYTTENWVVRIYKVLTIPRPSKSAVFLRLFHCFCYILSLCGKSGSQDR